MKKVLLTLALVMFCLFVQAQTAMTTSEIKSLYKTQKRSWVSIHDPSVVWDQSSNYFYIYGSHYYGAKTKDFNTYTPLVNFYYGGYDSNNAYKAFKKNPTRKVMRCLPGSTVQEEVDFGSFDASAFCSTYASVKVGDRQPTTEASWVSGDQWAPDIVYNPNMNKWCYYLSLNGDYWASVVVLMTSDSPEGPFKYQGPVVFGGFNGQSYSGKKVDYKDTDLEIVLGPQTSLPSRYITNRWGSYYPNCIDPCSFFDEEGELWLAYGSWSGGIYILKLDKNTGLRDYTYTYSGTLSSPSETAKSDAYFGLKIAGGAYVSGEGPYIQHIGDYYYLFMSYGGFAPDGGYEMRVFRSDKPTGPYVDASKNSAVFSSYKMNYGPKAATNAGMKLIGAMNNWGLMTTGECAQGHNSACQDDKGRTFLVCHTKFNDGTLGHQVRAYQMYLNKKGWLCTSPFQFDGETTTDADIATSQPYSAADIEGDYHLLIHPYRLDYTKYEEASPVTVHLSDDGKVSGAYTGTWKYTDADKSYIQIRLGATTYDGVVTEQTMEQSNAKALCFTAVCCSGTNSGVPCWGYKLQPQYALSYNYIKRSDTHFKLSKYLSINKNLDLWFTPEENVSLQWTSSQPEIVSETGKYYPVSEPTNVKLTANMSCGDYYWEYTYSGNARPVSEPVGDQTTGLVALYNFDDDDSSNALANVMSPDQTATLASANTSASAMPVLETDLSRFGGIVHTKFGAQGSNSYVSMPNPLYNETGIDGFTVSAWIKRADDNQWDALWSFFNSQTASAAGPRLYLTGNSYIGFNDNAGNWFDVNHPNSKDVDMLGVDEWHLVTFTFSQSEGYMLYVDGKPYTTANLVHTGSADKATFNNKLVISNVAASKYFYLGFGSFWGSANACYDDVMVYNRALTSTDVKGLYSVLNYSNPFDAGTIVGIHDVEVPSTSSSRRQANAYSINGSSISVPSRGIVIKDGKKVLVK